MKETVLVSGGAGYIGSHVAVELSQAGYSVVIVDNLSSLCLQGCGRVDGETADVLSEQSHLVYEHLSVDGGIWQT